ncbi:FAD-binding dehydrogenase [Alisedimentitalea sp. MJ-SS2]|uniref:FAD-binding dehydrogenase n=1 Tax=Aliisedimentitalea sp. MJ-SS2 TaxID=3049795 RepID=UPI00290C8A4A|nr:FAD-binding dehydrogenase [Alisedimentitalea sp. MJ-SS2]MDU8928764.1 FAD-binding dehydrogenase [Alisedimentitalea sp. MJ-SS2]
MTHTDIIIVGGGLAGLAAAHAATNRGRHVLLIDQEGEQSLGGQAFWSLGGLFMIDTPEQRRMGIRDSLELARTDWMGSAQFDRPEDENPRKVAEAYLEYAAGKMREDLSTLGMRWFPVVGWAERGGGHAHGHGNTVPRFHITWGAGEGIVAPYVEQALAAESAGTLRFAFRHRVTGLDVTDGRVTGVRGEMLDHDHARRGASTNRDVVGEFAYTSDSVILTTGGIGGNHDMVRKVWPVDRLGKPPKKMVAGVPDYVDGQMTEIAKKAGAGAINEDRMWHYTEGLTNWDPIWPNHGIRVLPGPSAMWFDALGERMEAPCLPGFDTLATLKRILQTGHEHSWLILTQKIIEKEFALSGSEQNPDFVSGKLWEVLKERTFSKGATKAVEAFKEHGEDFIISDDLDDLISKMNELTPYAPLDPAHIRAQIEARDAQITNKFSKDAQITAIHGARAYRGDKLVRTAKPHRLLDPSKGPLIAVRLNILTRKSLGGLHTDLQSRVLRPDGTPFDGLFAAGEVSGFGGGGYHGYNALEGTFLGGCIFSGKAAGDNA